MNEDCVGTKSRRAGTDKGAPVVPYTAKDFQLEVLGKLEEVQSLAESLEESLTRAEDHSGEATGEVR